MGVQSIENDFCLGWKLQFDKYQDLMLFLPRGVHSECEVYIENYALYPYNLHFHLFH